MTTSSIESQRHLEVPILSGLPPRSAFRTALRASPVLRRGLWLTLILAVLAGGSRIIAPLTLQYAIDHDLAPGAIHRAVVVGGVATVIAGISSWFLSLRIRGGVEVTIADLRQRGMQRVHDMAPSVIDRTRPADLVSRLTADLDAMTTFLNGGGVQFITNTAQLLIAAVILTVYSWQIAVPVFAIAVALGWLMMRMQARIRRRFDLARRELAGLQSAVTEAVTGAVVIRSTGSQHRNRSELDDAVDRTRDSFLRVQPALHLNTSLGEIGITAMTLTVLLGGVWWSISAPVPRLSAGELVSLIVLVTFFVRPLQFLMQSLGESQNALTGWVRTLELVTTPAGTHGTVPLPDGPIRVEFDHVSAAYPGGPTVLHDVSVQIPAGQKVAVVGRTGSGKSTFARLLTRRLEPNTGQILLSGVPVDRLDPASMAGRVVVVPQDPFLFDLSVADNIALGRPGADRAEVEAALANLDLTGWAASLPDGLETRTGPRGEFLSVGMRQLVALARTALADPDLVVLDEATSGVDPATDLAVQRALTRLLRGRTSIIIAHRLSVASTADRILEFSAGRVAADGTHQDLVAAGGSYADLFAHWLTVSESTTWRNP